MQTKYLCVLIHIWTKGEVGAPFSRFKPSSKIFYWPFQGGTFFVDLLCVVFFCLVFAMPLCTSVYMCLVVTCWERADLLALVCGVSLWVCHFPIGILGQVWYLIVSIPGLCTLTYFGTYRISVARGKIFGLFSYLLCVCEQLKAQVSLCICKVSPESSFLDCQGKPDSEFVVANTLAKWKSLSQMKLTLAS